MLSPVRVVVLWLVPLWAVVFVGQKVVVLVTRRRRPRAAAAIERWWPWAPLMVAVPMFVGLIGVLVWKVPLLGIPLAAASLATTYAAFFGPSSLGSPFRPRR